ncbi:uncharacterized protein LOC131253264 isoform X2 [Magnolia sinica]|uniref:uncharacterized protein LOC131253264 isoform X2 n=1 Tax=Magnolia sinica TaxID=86752 RepID=UPI002657BE08|nr:uncharacterized protein LOC131253264 isoform X2 [Magnolia sinica]
MAEQYNSNLLETIDRVWFHQNVMTITETPQILPTLSPSTPLSQEKNGISEHLATPLNSDHQLKREWTPKQRLDFILEHSILSQPTTSEDRNCSVSTTTREKPSRRIEKMRSCKSHSELEHEELKGFMDLGFIFNEEELSPYMRTVLPGLQTLRERKRVVSRPYLSEAWLINRPDSPLLNLRIPLISAASGTDMKKHLRFWARTVASVIHQES